MNNRKYVLPISLFLRKNQSFRQTHRTYYFSVHKVLCNRKMISNTGPHGQPRHGTWHGTGEGDCVDCNIIIIIIVFTLSLYPPLLLVPKISGWSLYATIHLDIGMICSAPNNTSAHLLLLALFSSWSYHPTCFPLQLMRGHRLMSSKGPTLI